MNWFDVLKNQAAATSEGMFELDFSEPMVEPEEPKCKPKLLALAKRLESFSQEGYSVWSIVKPDFDSVSEETCCLAINFFKALSDRDGGYTKNYDLSAYKNNFYDASPAFNTTYLKIPLRSYATSITISEGEGTVYYAYLSYKIPNDYTDEQVEKIGQEFKQISDRLFVL